MLFEVQLDSNEDPVEKMSIETGETLLFVCIMGWNKVH
jgi:hypothetical protein